MDEEQLQSRLSQIVTKWSLLQQAHGGTEQQTANAQSELMERYRGAAYRYLVAILRDPDAADEVCQDFALRFVRGDLSGANPERGKFRSFLKTVLSRMVIDYHRRKQKAARTGIVNFEILEELTEDEVGAEFEQSWTAELMNHALLGLQEMEKQSGQPYHAVLRYQMNRPEMKSRDVTDALNSELKPKRPFTEVGVRKILQRARGRFSELLLREVQMSIETSDLDVVEEELGELGLLKYCKPAIDSRRGQLS